MTHPRLTVSYGIQSRTKKTSVAYIVQILKKTFLLGKWSFLFRLENKKLIRDFVPPDISQIWEKTPKRVYLCVGKNNNMEPPHWVAVKLFFL